MARYCFTAGRFPRCSAMLECPRNFVSVWRTTNGCITGHIIRCCEVMAHIKQPLKSKRPVTVPPSYGPSTLKKNKSYKGIFK